jgi:DNA-binding transcriptional regulator YhcF (GntR family)
LASSRLFSPPGGSQVVPAHLTTPTSLRLEEWASVKSPFKLDLIVSLDQWQNLSEVTVRLWFAPSSEVPIYRQLVTQVVLAILSGDLRPGERLPSTRELARRFAINPNTVSAGYRQLEREGWAERRHGSGVYVRVDADPPTTPEQILDRHIAGFFRALRELNLPAAVVRARLADWLVAPPPDHLLLIESDPEFRQILLTEIRAIATCAVEGVSLDDCNRPGILTAAIPLCRPSKVKVTRSALPAGVELITLRIRSANAWIGPWLPSLSGKLIAVASAWPEFIITARTMLTALGLDPENAIYRDVRKPRWGRGLEMADAIICDAHTAALPAFPTQAKAIVFPMLADSMREELRCYPDAPSAL